MLSDMTDQVRQLLLLRHAKAEHTIGVSDHERRLIERGKRDAAAVGEWLMHFAATIDLVICSTSSRTRQTWEAIEHAGVTATEVEFARGVYSAGAAGVMNLVREADPSVQRILVVGHEPTMSWLAERLTGGDGEGGACRAGLLDRLEAPRRWQGLIDALCRRPRSHPRRSLVGAG